MKESYPTREIAALLGISLPGILKRAQREGWHSQPRKGQGGGHEWLVASMPETTRLAIAAKV